MQHTSQPIVTGTSVLGIRCAAGVVMAADTCGSYGSLARFRDLRRLRKVGAHTVVGGSGDYSDFEYTMEMLDALLIEDTSVDSEPSFSPRELHEYLGRVYYNRRSKFDPLWNYLVVGGVRDGEITLGYVDLQGTYYEDDTVATGYGAYIARPLLCKAHRPDLTLAEARQIIEDAMRVMFYRDARALSRIQVAVVGTDGTFEVTEPFDLATDWTVGERKY
eukprot:Amastigsp_a508529_1019.p1 type:complete len:219 gc:universal Amastigsp_a508529_1019:34-690(+)